MISEKLTIEQLQMVKKFQRFVIKAEIPLEPCPLDEPEFNWMIDRFMEEINETKQAYKDENFAGIIDGLVDLIYFAYGGIVRQGMSPKACFEAVHLANLNKERGVHDKRPIDSGNDAVKPINWVDPITRLEKLSKLSLKDIESIEHIPKIMHEVVALVKRKSSDYNTGGVTFSGEKYNENIHNPFEVNRAEYFPFGDKSYLQMLHTKFQRLKSLSEKKERGLDPNFEGVQDTLKDMIAYIVFYSKYIENEMSSIHGEDSNVE